jgi:hypothetical protein
MNILIDNVHFIENESSLSQASSDNFESGLLAFYRLIGSIYFKSCSHMFMSVITEKQKHFPGELFAALCNSKANLPYVEKLLYWLSEIRSKNMRSAKAEDYYMPSSACLRYHWMRTASTSQVWGQADQNMIEHPVLTEWGWCVDDNKIVSVKWDSDSSLNNIDKRIKLWTSGCSASVCDAKTTHVAAKGRGSPVDLAVNVRLHVSIHLRIHL